MAEETKLLIRKRGTIKSKLTSFNSFLEHFDNRENVTNALYIELKTRIGRVETLLVEFEEINRDIEMTSSTDELYDAALKEREKFETDYYHSVTNGNLLLSEFSKKFEIEPIKENLDAISVSGSVASSAITAQSRPKLPAIPIPTFSGTVEHWLEFKDMFESLVHNNASISSVEKFHFLKKAVQGEALKMVQSRKMTAENYDIIWKLLCERYDDKPMLVEYHLDNLLNLPNVQKESATDLLNMLDTLTEVLYHLEKLGLSIDSWDPFIIHIMVKRLDQNSFLKWEERRPKGKLASLLEFKDFLGKRVDNLKNIERKNKNDNKSDLKKNVKIDKPHKSFVSTTFSMECAVCRHKHEIQNCQKYLKMKTYARYELAKRLSLCLNCLKRSDHISRSCEAPGCEKCGKQHHILLHYEPRPGTVLGAVAHTSSLSGGAGVDNGGFLVDGGGTQALTNEGLQVTSLFLDNGEEVSGEVLLSTALVNVKGVNGKWHVCRALLDSGSQPNLITNELVARLGIERQEVNVSIFGVGNSPSKVGEKCSIRVQSMYKNFETNVACLVVSTISGMTPSQGISISHLNIPANLQLADCSFNKPQQVSLLLGASVFYSLLCIGQIKLGENQPTLQKTKLGWLVTGSLMVPNRSEYTSLHIGLVDLHNDLKKFWEIEEVPADSQGKSIEEEICEKLFRETTVRGSKGKFIVHIPLMDSVNKLGNSRHLAQTKFWALERKLQKNPLMGEMYRDFMQEYLQLGHLSLVKSTPSTDVSFYMPHHGVIKESSETTKLRVVFDGSARSDTGVSINDLQCNGPKQQDDLFFILVRFRQHQIVVCADVAKMYRMIWVTPDQRALQKIIWRFSPDEELAEWTLNTVTYGTKSAPYLAIRCLRQLALDNLDRYPEASAVILSDFYVDDLLTGAESPERSIRLCKDVANILGSGGMDLRKWVSNDSEVQRNFNGENWESSQMEFGEKDKNKTLGLWWHFREDNLRFLVEFSDATERVSKRSILSEVSKIFDPLGLVSPSVVLAKILIQKLWLEKLEWDGSLPLSLETEWVKIKTEMGALNDLIISRKVIRRGSTHLEIHAFCDASMTAYGGSVYIRSVTHDGRVQVALLCSKVRVSPLKKLTIPRLELCGALLIAQLVSKVKEALAVEISTTWFWCDSTVVLGWINTASRRLQTFIGNRVSQIQELTNPGDWRHVRSEDNPADVLSLGMYPSQLIGCLKWWNGPYWLESNQSEWPVSQEINSADLPEMKVQLVSLPLKEEFPFHIFSDLSRLQRALCHIFRFIDIFKRKPEVVNGFITSNELSRAMIVLVKLSQKESFGKDILALSQNKSLSNLNFQKLSPFLDQNGLLRVGGRLLLADISFSKKHPLILSSKHKFTEMLMEREHKRLLHAGPQLLLCSLRERFWIIGGRNLSRSIVHKCVRCFRSNPVSLSQQMGVLPLERVKPAPPFHTTGVDYAGPLQIKTKYGRGAKTIKCYICLFICCATKAIHIEVVSNLTSEAFFACFRRFVSRRGKPLKMLSDNGSNFVGANAELVELGNFLKTQSESLSNSIHNEGIDWSFIPANSPNFGGLWESGIRSCKLHLKRVLGNSVLTYEDLSTVLTQIEAVLNSRPLVPLSSNPTDFDALTPSHFLIGRRLTSLPDPDVQHISLNRLSRYQHMQMLCQHFWSRWSMEYLGELQQRNKWYKEQKNLEVGQLVVIKDNNLPPLNWKLGRVSAVYLGPDSKVRVASIKTQDGVYKRGITKLCRLPVETE